MEIPFKLMHVALDSMELIKAMAATGNPNSVSDAGVGAVCARSAVIGAFMNVRINASGYEDKQFVAELVNKGKQMEQQAIAIESEILNIVNQKIDV
jgi:glutamate formiminotransferase/formiminotetrahydrofolate cyclodeaminase